MQVFLRGVIWSFQKLLYLCINRKDVVVDNSPSSLHSKEKKTNSYMQQVQSMMIMRMYADTMMWLSMMTHIHRRSSLVYTC